MSTKSSSRQDLAHLISAKRRTDLCATSANIDLYRINKQSHESASVVKGAHVYNASVRS